MGRERAEGVGVAERQRVGGSFLEEQGIPRWPGWEEGSTGAWTVGTAANPPPPVQPAPGKRSPIPTSRLPFVSPGLVQIPVSMYQTVVTSLAQGNGPVQVAMAPVTTRISDSTVTVDGQAVEVVTLEQ